MTRKNGKCCCWTWTTRARCCTARQAETDYEVEGYYRGCVFPCGKVVIDGTLLVYYGGADKYCAVATCPLEEILKHLLSCPA